MLYDGRMSESTRPVSVRLGPAHMARLDAIAKASGLTRSKVLQRLLEDCEDAPDGIAPLDRSGLLGVMNERARNGSTAALRYLIDRADQDEQLARLRELTTEPA